MSANTLPEVTVVVAAYNHQEFVRQALTAIAAQDYPALRVIVTDDASTDGTRDQIESCLRDLRLAAERVFHSVNTGLCAMLNEVLGMIETPFYTCVSADDWLTPDSVSRRVATLLQSPPDTALVYSDMHLVDSAGTDKGMRYSQLLARPWPGGKHGSVYTELVEWDWIPAPTVLLRTDAVRSVFGYDERLVFEDYDLWLRLARHYRMACVEEPLVYYRDHAGSMTHSFGRSRKLDFWVTTVRLLAKHVGQPGQGRRLYERLFETAQTAYLLGMNPAELAPVFAVAARQGISDADYFRKWAQQGVPGEEIRRAILAEQGLTPSEDAPTGRLPRATPPARLVSHPRGDQRFGTGTVHLAPTVELAMPVICDGEGTVEVADGVRLGYKLAPFVGDGALRLQARSPQARICVSEGTMLCNNVGIFAMSSVSVGPHCVVASETLIMDCDFHDLSPSARADLSRRSRSVGLVDDVVIGANVWIGARVTILRGARVGDGCVIAAGAVVGPGDYPPNSLIAGVPAKVVRALE